MARRGVFVFARNCPSTDSLIHLPDGSTREVHPPRAPFDVHLDLSAGAARVLSQEWTDLTAHHARIPAAARGFRSAALDLGRALPFDLDPIPPRS